MTQRDWQALTIGLMAGLLIGALVGGAAGRYGGLLKSRGDAVDAGVGRWAVDPATGAVRFVYGAEGTGDD